jgi:flagellar basal-body rod modification protein FlgD
MAAAIFHQAMARTAVPLASSTGSSDSSNANDSATLSSNDFLTLLVTEMQNQDPTADTDPNEYIDQLVQVNSLEQLININQTLSTDLGAPSSSATGDSADNPASAANLAGASPAASGPHAFAAASSSGEASATVAQQQGNLSIPGASAASERVAQALEQPSHAGPGMALVHHRP